MFDAICPAVYKQLRIRAGMTQAQLGTAIHTSRMTVMRFENGRARPEKEQEEKLMELAKCSNEEFVELICERLSALLGRRVGIFESEGAYQQTTALAKAYELLKEHAAEIRPVLARALQNKVSLTQFLGLAFERNNAGLVELTRDCNEQLKSDRRQASRILPASTRANGVAAKPVA